MPKKAPLIPMGHFYLFVFKPVSHEVVFFPFKKDTNLIGQSI